MNAKELEDLKAESVKRGFEAAIKSELFSAKQETASADHLVRHKDFEKIINAIRGHLDRALAIYKELQKL